MRVRPPGATTLRDGCGRKGMGLTDPIADMLTRVRNAARAGHDKVDVPSSKIKQSIAQVLAEEGYVQGFEVVEKTPRAAVRIHLKYDASKKSVIGGLERASKPGLRKYVSHDEIPRVMGGLGIAILTTSRGLMTDRRARAERIGGEIVCVVW